MPIIVFVTIRCPYCLAKIEGEEWFPWDYLGMPYKQCVKCRRFFRTGKDEWVDLSGFRKTLWCIRGFILIPGGMIAIGWVAVEVLRIIFPSITHHYLYYIIWIGISIFLIFFMLDCAIKDVRESIKRTKLRNSPDA